MNYRTPHNFLLHLRNTDPSLARRFDSITSLGLSGDVLTIAADVASWPGSDLAARLDEVTAKAREFFSPKVTVEMKDAKPDANRLPFLVNSSKIWNYAAFVTLEGGKARVRAVPKTVYAELLKTRATKSEKMISLEYPAADLGAFLGALPTLVDDLCALMVENRSYAQFITPFMGDQGADRLEFALYGVKEWGTPATPGPLMQKYIGRFHYCDPAASPFWNEFF